MWCSGKSFPNIGDEVEVRIFSDENGPTESQRRLFTELLARFPGIRNTVAGPLAREYSAIRESWKTNSPEITRPEDIWSVARLFAVEISRDDTPNSVIGLDYSINWDAGHELNVVLANWQVTEVGLLG